MRRLITLILQDVADQCGRAFHLHVSCLTLGVWSLTVAMYNCPPPHVQLYGLRGARTLSEKPMIMEMLYENLPNLRCELPSLHVGRGRRCQSRSSWGTHAGTADTLPQGRKTAGVIKHVACSLDVLVMRVRALGGCQGFAVL